MQFWTTDERPLLRSDICRSGTEYLETQRLKLCFYMHYPHNIVEPTNSQAQFQKNNIVKGLQIHSRFIDQRERGIITMAANTL